MSNEIFLMLLQNAFVFFKSIMDEFMNVFAEHPWLFSLVIAPVIVALIIFGVNIAYSLLQKNDTGKGER